MTLLRFASAAGGQAARSCASRLTAHLETVRTRLRRIAGDDQGTSLTELLVGMAIMTIFMAIFTSAVFVMFRTANKVQATSISASQTSQAFLRLDGTVRYAAAISTPGLSTTSGDWYIEFNAPSSTAPNVNMCTQLRIDSMQLLERTWTVAAGTASTASAWLPIASDVSNGSAAAGSTNVPFTLVAAGSTASTTFQQLQVTLVTTAGTSVSSTNRAQMTFTAVNSDVAQTSNATICQQWGRP